MTSKPDNKIVIVLQNIVTFRSNWNHIAECIDDATKLFLITGKLGKRNLSEENRRAFATHIVCEHFDFASVKEACERILKSERCVDFSSVRVVTNDEYFLGLAADIRESIGVPGISKAHILPFINKMPMKEVVSKSKVRVPKAIKYSPTELLSNVEGYINKIEKKLGYPIFAKQVDSAGSEKVAQLVSRSHLLKWCLQNKHHTNYELDEYITGVLYHIDGLIKDGELIEQLICRNACPNSEFLYGKPMGSVQISESDTVFEMLSQATKEVLSSFDCLPDGALHLELFVTNEGEVVFLEVAARAPGGWIPQMHQITQGYNIEEQHFLLQMDEFSQLVLKTGAYAAWIWFPQKEGRKVKQNTPLVSTSKLDIVWDLGNGMIQQRPVSIRDKVCGVLLENDDYLNLESDYSTLLTDFSPYE